MTIKQGDYVLATKYSDGDPKDPWGVGFFDEFDCERFYVMDSQGVWLRYGGFRRCEAISKDLGKYICDHIEDIQQGSISLWDVIT